MPNSAAPNGWRSGLVKFFRRLALRPYGDELLTRSGDFWVFCARLIVVIMASAEAISWGYMGFLTRAHPTLAATIAAGFVFTVVWIIDATFLTLDNSRSFYERALTGRSEGETKERIKFLLGVVARIGIVSGSLIITAPFLAQAIFSSDVDAEINRRNAEAVAHKRVDVEKPFVERLKTLQGEKAHLEQDRVREAAGIGPSRRYGRGPAVKTIESQLSDKTKEIEATENARQAMLVAFDQYSPSALSKLYGVKVISSGVHSSNEVLQELLKTQDFSRAELAVRGFLGFLFLGLLVLKFFQPRSIDVYYNEQLHSIFDRYQKGLFDQHLPPAERASSGGSIDPLRFEDWCLNTYAAVRTEDELRKKSECEFLTHELLIANWQRLETDARSEINPLLHQHEAAVKQVRETEEQLHTETAEMNRAQATFESVKLAHDSITAKIDKGDMPSKTLTRVIAVQANQEIRCQTLSATLSKHTGVIDQLRKLLEHQTVETAMLAQEIQNRRQVIADAQLRIGQERLALAQIIADQRADSSAHGVGRPSHDPGKSGGQSEFLN